MSETTPSEAETAAAGAPQEEHADEVRRVRLGDREFILVGTAHVSHRSVELVREVIERERPDCVCVELDPQRYEALAKKQQWEALDVKEVIRRKQFATLMVNLLLAAYQKRMGLQLGIQPGEELLEATRVAAEHDIPVELCDRDVRVTLRRAIAATPFWRRLVLGAELLASVFDSPKITEEQLQELKKQDVLNELMAELGRYLPSLKRVLIDERDAYLTERMRQAPGRRIVAVVGAGHLQGICGALAAETEVDLEPLDVIPPISPVWKVLGWGVPILIVGSIAWIGYSKGVGAAGDNVLYWILVNGGWSSLGGLLALAHPLTILTAFVAAPITSLTPVIGAGYVCVFVQAVLVPPVVKEFQTLGEDLVKVRRWWQSKLLRLFLVFVLTGWGSLLGSVQGLAKIISNLFQ
jgi:pheromone shutdown-related protein TraB